MLFRSDDVMSTAWWEIFGVGVGESEPEMLFWMLDGKDEVSRLIIWVSGCEA